MNKETKNLEEILSDVTDKTVKENMLYIQNVLEESRKDNLIPDHLYSKIINLGYLSDFFNPNRKLFKLFNITQTHYTLSEAATLFELTGNRKTSRLNSILNHPDIPFVDYLTPDRGGSTSYFYHLSHRTLVRMYLILYLSNNHTQIRIAEWQGLIAKQGVLLPSKYKAFTELSSDAHFTEKLLNAINGSLAYSNELSKILEQDHENILQLVKYAESLNDMKLQLHDRVIAEKETTIKMIDREIDKIEGVYCIQVQKSLALLTNEIAGITETNNIGVETPQTYESSSDKEPVKKKGLLSRLFGGGEVNQQQIQYFVQLEKKRLDELKLPVLNEQSEIIKQQIATLEDEVQSLRDEKVETLEEVKRLIESRKELVVETNEILSHIKRIENTTYTAEIHAQLIENQIKSLTELATDDKIPEDKKPVQITTVSKE